MRVITGKYKGKRLNCLDDETIRPTLDRVKVCLFDILQFDIMDAKVLDLFAGSGALGIECLSRGAQYVAFSDINNKCIRILRQNLESLKLDVMPRIYTNGWSDALSGKNDIQYDIIFIDPPYNSGLYYDVLKRINDLCVLSENGVAVCEHDAKEKLPERVGNLAKYKDRRMGNVILSFYKYDIKEAK